MVKFTTQLFLNVFLTMVCIYIIKTVSIKYNIPFVKQVSEKV